MDTSSIEVGWVVDPETGLPVEVSRDDEGFVICMLWEQGQVRFPNCIAKPCSVCGASLSVAPSSVAALEKAPGLSVICMNCVLKGTKES